MATDSSVIRIEFSHKIERLESDLGRLELVAALTTGNYREAVRIRRRMAGAEKPLTTVEAGMLVLDCEEAGQ